MSDFMKWLYQHYIKPELDCKPREEYEMSISLMETNLTSQERETWEKSQEFVAIHAFLLGLATGRGLPL